MAKNRLALAKEILSFSSVRLRESAKVMADENMNKEVNAAIQNNNNKVDKDLAPKINDTSEIQIGFNK